MAKKKAITAQQIKDLYYDHILSHGAKPKNIYSFAKENGFTEAEFYQFFTSFEVIEKSTFTDIFEHSINLLEKDEAYPDYDAQNKLLSFYYTLFEMFKANRSLVFFYLNKKNGVLANLKVLSTFKEAFMDYIDSIEIELPYLQVRQLEQIKERSVREGAYAQFLIILKFWMDDTSPNFEKTDVFIEKSMHTAFQILDNNVLSSIVDLGKFIFKEKVNPTI